MSFLTCHYFSKLSDDIIERLRDALIDIIIDPPRISDKYVVGWPDWDDDFCGTPPWKWSWPHPNIDIVSKLNSLPQELSFAKQRYEGLASSRKKMESLLSKMPTIEKSSYLSIEASRHSVTTFAGTHGYSGCGGPVAGGTVSRNWALHPLIRTEAFL